jgi:hypothetical protein
MGLRQSFQALDGVSRPVYSLAWSAGAWWAILVAASGCGSGAERSVDGGEPLPACVAGCSLGCQDGGVGETATCKRLACPVGPPMTAEANAVATLCAEQDAGEGTIVELCCPASDVDAKSPPMNESKACDWSGFTTCATADGGAQLGLPCPAELDGPQTLAVPAAPPYSTPATCFGGCCVLDVP